MYFARRRAGLRAGGDRAQPPAGGARAARAPARRQRGRGHATTRSRSRSRAPRPTRRSSRCATACSRDRQSFYLDNQAEQTLGDGRRGVHPPVLRERALDPAAARRAGRAGGGLRARRPRPRSSPSGAAARSRSAPPSAAASAASSSWPSATRGSRSTRRSSRPSAGASSASRRSTGLQQALGLDALPVRIECFDISNLGGTHTTSSMVVFEGGAPKKSDYRRFNIREVEPAADDFAAMDEVLGRRLRAVRAPERALARTTPTATRRSPRCPNVVVIDGGKGQLAGRPRAAAGLPRARRDRRLAGQADRGGVRARARRSRSCSPHDTPELQLLQRVRDEAHRFAITHHRIRRDKAMTESILDDLPGIGPARKRALLKHFGSPEAVLAATREELERVPGLPAEGRARALRPSNKTGPMTPHAGAMPSATTAAVDERSDGSRARTSRTSSSSPGSPAPASRPR